MPIVVVPCSGWQILIVQSGVLQSLAWQQVKEFQHSTLKYLAVICVGGERERKSYFWNILEIFPSRTPVCLVDIELRDDVTVLSPSVRQCEAAQTGSVSGWDVTTDLNVKMSDSQVRPRHAPYLLLSSHHNNRNNNTQPHAQLSEVLFVCLFFFFLRNVFYDVFSRDLSVVRCRI